jgi:hypothetical protein
MTQLTNPPSPTWQKCHDLYVKTMFELGKEYPGIIVEFAEYPEITRKEIFKMETAFQDEWKAENFKEFSELLFDWKRAVIRQYRWWKSEKERAALIEKYSKNEINF